MNERSSPDLPARTAASGRASNARSRARPGDPLGKPPRHLDAPRRKLWREAVSDWPQLDFRDRTTVLDWIDTTMRLEAAKADLDKHGNLDANGHTTGAFRVYRQLHNQLSALRRDLAATTATREKVPIRAPQRHRASPLAEMLSHPT